MRLAGLTIVPSMGGTPRVRTASARWRKRATISWGSNTTISVGRFGGMAGRRHQVEPDLASSHYTGPAVKEVRGRAEGWDAVVRSQVDKEFS